MVIWASVMGDHGDDDSDDDDVGCGEGSFGRRCVGSRAWVKGYLGGGDG